MLQRGSPGEGYLSQHWGMSARAPKKSQNEEVIFVLQTVKKNDVQHSSWKPLKPPSQPFTLG